MSRAHSIMMPCTCVNNTSCNQPKVVREPEIQALRDKERQHRVADTQAVCSMVLFKQFMLLKIIVLY